MSDGQYIVFALVADGLLSLPRILRAAFTHPWVATYQVGFGPPLVRATPKLAEEVRGTRSALEKLDVYLTHCVLDRDECRRLADLQRRLIVRRKGPVEAEDLANASADALDLSLRLYAPDGAPPRVRRSMELAGVDASVVPPGANPEHLAGRFLIRLADPRNERMFYNPTIANVPDRDPAYAMALELRTPVNYRGVWQKYLDALALIAPFTPVSLGAPAAHARVSRDGQRA